LTELKVIGAAAGKWRSQLISHIISSSFLRTSCDRLKLWC